MTGLLIEDAFKLLKALQAIVELDPENTAAGFNEWGEAQCFRDAQQIAKDALAKVTK